MLRDIRILLLFANFVTIWWKNVFILFLYFRLKMFLKLTFVVATLSFANALAPSGLAACRKKNSNFFCFKANCWMKCWIDGSKHSSYTFNLMKAMILRLQWVKVIIFLFNIASCNIFEYTSFNIYIILYQCYHIKLSIVCF